MIKNKLVFIFGKSFDFILFLGIPIMLVIIAISDLFVPVFFGEGYEKVSIILKVLSPMILITGLDNVTGVQFLLPTKKQKEFTIAVIVGAICNCILNFVFIKLWLSVGASFASVLTEILVFAIEILYCSKYINFKEIFKLINKKIIAGVIMFFSIFFIPVLINPIITISIKVIIGIIIYLLLLFFMNDSFCRYLLEKFINLIQRI